MRSRSIPPEFTQAMAISTTVAAVIRRGTKYFISVPPSHKSLQSARETRPLFHERVRDQETAAREESPECCFLAAKRSEEHTSELQSHSDLVCRLLLEKKNIKARFPE